jgi:hypothetical protein
MRTKYTKELLEPIILKALCWNDVCRALGVTWNSGTVKKHLRKVTNFHGIDYSHFMGKSKAKLNRTKASDALTKNSGFSRMTVRKIIIEDNLLPYRCSLCDLEPKWQGKELTLILDHIDGNAKDHRLTNLRFVCPNCSMQLPTNCGRNIGRW